jgi:hypothetical protein
VAEKRVRFHGWNLSAISRSCRCQAGATRPVPAKVRTRAAGRPLGNRIGAALTRARNGTGTGTGNRSPGASVPGSLFPPPASRFLLQSPLQVRAPAPDISAVCRLTLIPNRRANPLRHWSRIS